MKVTAIGGIPASGKTTLMRKVLARLDSKTIGVDWKVPYLVGRDYPRYGISVLGDYTKEKEIYAGTDKLSMAVQPHALHYLLNVAPSLKTDFVMYEGDRLFSASFFRELQAREISLRIIVLTVEPEVQLERFRFRGSNQSPTFLRGRMTKVQNIINLFDCELAPNNTVEESERTVESIVKDALDGVLLLKVG